MTDRSAPKLSFWPFILVDILFLGLTWLIYSHTHRPFPTFGEFLALILCAAIGAWSFLTPFLRRNAAEQKIAELGNLANTVAQIQNLDQIAAQLSGATQHLKEAQEQSNQTVAASKQIAEKMAEERRAFSEFIQKANDTEKNHLRLEVEKLRRAEADWLQILVHILDHIFALNQAAVMSGKPALIQQIGNFQNVCRDTARRIGLICHVPDAQQAFDEKLHQVLEGQLKPENGAVLAETLAAGYSYQGHLVRRAVVKVPSEAVEKFSASEKEVVESKTAQETLL
ncbi:MAG: nucleotide exchange factor GrpE [Verrucomicrobiota bacterium]